LGQNFLIDRLVLKKIIDSADLQPNDIVLEIGPGIGTLTLELAKRVKKVIAVEKDKRMVEILKETLKDLKNIEIIKEDILKLDPKPYTLKSYKIVANLPYYIVTPVIRKFLELTETRSLSMVLMVQKEVAQRILAKPPAFGEVRPSGRPKMNLLAVSVQFYAKPEILFYVSKKSFWPQPKVDSAIIKISKTKNQKPKEFKDLFFKIVKVGFSQPRKQLINNLSKELKIEKEKVKEWLQKNKIQPTQRAETLSIEDWIKLTKSFKI
jgi:16S rRNA (adenine1518-N6/adenine1519-N6)-dimethyltransferase